MLPVRSFLLLPTLFLALTVLPLSAADKPADPAKLPPYKRLLQDDDAKKAAQLEQQINKHWAAGEFEDALKAAEKVAQLRTKSQGAEHWETADARWQVILFERVLKGDTELRKEVAGIPSLFAEAGRLAAKGQYRDAQPVRDQLLEIHRKVLGEEHPKTAGSYAWKASNLHRLGQYGAAQALYQKSLDICRKLLGEEHPDTARNYSNLGQNLDAQGKYAQAAPLHQKSADIFRKVLGEENLGTARTYNNLAYNLGAQGKHAEAEHAFQKALDISRKVLGEEHPDTAIMYSNLADNLDRQGNYAAAAALNRKVLEVRRKVLGDKHPDTGTSYNNLGMNLYQQGDYAAAQTLLQKALDILRAVLGDEHASTAQSYSNLGLNLVSQGKCAAAQPLNQKALDIRRKVLGEDHPKTAESYNNLAHNLEAQDQFDEAGQLFARALEIRRKTLGEDHPETAESYSNLAIHLSVHGQHNAAQPLHEKALAIRRKVLGEMDPRTAISYHCLAYSLQVQGRFREAQEFYEKALEVRREILGEKHLNTCLSLNNWASTLKAQGNYELAEKGFTTAAEIFLKVRVSVAASGLDRAAVTSERSPLPSLAALLARNGKSAEAWERFEQSIGRGTWDDLSVGLCRDPAERAKQNELLAQLNRLDLLIQQTIKRQDTPELKKQRQELLNQRREQGNKLAQLTADLEKKYGPIAGQVFDRAAIQEALPADAALLGWIDLAGQPKAVDPNGEHWAFLLRSSGEPILVRLAGSGDKDAWTDDDTKLPRHLRDAMQDSRNDWQPLAKKLRAQRLDPLAKHLAGVRRLIVLPSPALAGVPVEVIADGYIVSYALSGTMFAYLRKQPRSAGAGMLTLADPVFDRPGQKKLEPLEPLLPPGGLLLTVVTPNANAANARLQAGDVLLKYAGTELKTTAELLKLIEAHATDKEIAVTVWREGRTGERQVGPGKLGVVLAKDPAPIALAEKHKIDDMLAKVRGGDDGQWDQLPGTRVEAEALRRLCDKSKMPYRLLADSDASEQELDTLVASKDLDKFRFIHLATHGTLDDRFPLRSAVILSRDRLPDALQQAQAGKPVYDGRMTAEKVLGNWHLDAELVTLSACQTALGKYERGEGFVGFSQALLLSGSRNVCLSLWKVDDTATALLMEHFYENLLTGKPAAQARAVSKVAALEEAKAWLQNLSAEEVTRRAASLTNGVARGKGRPALPLLPAATAKPATKNAKPFAHPYYWAAFVLVGDGE